MDIMVSENLKTFRRERGNTQEELSNHLGISVQAVSKWERGEGYPDITLLPSIAAYYDRTVDELLGCGEIQQQKKIEEIMKQYGANNNQGKIEDNIILMRKALKEFPNNLSLMENLAHSMLFTDKGEYMDECIKLCETILSKSIEDRQRYAVLQTTVYAYNKKGDKEKAREYAEKLPDYYCTRNVVLECVLKGEELLELAQHNIVAYVSLIDDAVGWMLRAKEYTPKEKIFAYETVAKLYQLFLYDENYGYKHTGLHMLWMNIAKEYAQCRNSEKTVDALNKAYQHAHVLDHFQSGSYTSMFADKGTYSKDGFSRNFEASYMDWLQKTMENPVFDFVRETEAFRRIGEGSF